MSEQDKVDKYPSMTIGDHENNKRVVEKATIGVQLKAIRTENKLTLEEASKRTGLARSTLSKIENEQISPTFSVMQKLASGLNIELPQLFTKPKETKVTGRRDVTLGGQGRPHATLTYEHELLSTQLRNKKMMPYKSRVHARNFEHFGEWVRHEGEEFLLVLEGEVQLLTEFYEPAALVVGDSAYYDATMGHLVISTSKEDALILWITAE
ncbi:MULTISPECIES: helix-turn-helix domain-containing protein [Colwellia]|uniref:DNA-binding protein n=1 Tax=Colwellia psychrerythraea (strain 34H / ATCC BAA-681) TaxID=167879 RepID=Q47XG5_COLP3|nr:MULTISPECIES: XRE family transcriptional regulator [Colwellia]AAZ23965.1 DNA-binding protein [Colwellia psychrerythraea 34H]PKH86552.1 XRE family transcriptional regulator [Colwellia sp. Bg11-28]